ncbi:Sulfotransferase family protein [Gimesia alba]|uniref:Sulfotransferase family protein n=1 Tax=Gimesia alba TaxID=2527973 RepID=A0A517RFU3_9PLAN|nr:sulfotransferase family 2 domain-containing protein [Gimesia alba]QDT42752.1 Sulfotransferase family protein [Gimesia alba]
MKFSPQRTGLADYLRAHEHPGGIIVSDKHKFLYMKPAKTAGTSILRECLQSHPLGLFNVKDDPKRFQEWINAIRDEELEEYFIFAVARNPWDRVVSIASYFKIPVRDFINRIDFHWQNKAIKYHSLPISSYTHHDGHPFVDFVCRFETLQPDMDQVFDQLKIKREKLPITNQSEHAHYSTYYTEQEIKKVAALYQHDIDYFGYCFGQTV